MGPRLDNDKSVLTNRKCYTLNYIIIILVFHPPGFKISMEESGL